MDRRKPGQSQLDYLWVNFGNKFITSDIKEVDPDAIPSIQLLKDVSGISGSIAQITVEDGFLLAKNSDGEVISSVNTDEIGGLSIIDFKKRVITDKDIELGCTLPVGTGVLSIKLSNGVEYLSETLDGGETATAQTIVDGNTIYTDVKISKLPGNVFISKNYDGLKANVDIDHVVEQIKEELSSEILNNWIEVN